MSLASRNWTLMQQLSEDMAMCRSICVLVSSQMSWVLAHSSQGTAQQLPLAFISSPGFRATICETFA